MAYLGSEAVPLSLMSAHFSVSIPSALLWASVDAQDPNQGVASNGIRLLHLTLPLTHVLVVKPKSSSTERNSVDGLSATNASPSLKLSAAVRIESGNKMKRFVADHLSHSHLRLYDRDSSYDPLLISLKS
jgi:hypothetical protein